MRAFERLLKYAGYHTASDPLSENCPSTEGQRVFALALAEEMRALGMVDVEVDEHAYVYGAIPSNVGEGGLVIGLIAHLDTVSDVPASPMNASVIYCEKPVVTLKNGTAVSVEPAYVGKHLVVTDGNTLLGADDKAGIAAIMTLAEELQQHPELRHGRIAVAFTPDEEIGRGADRFDVARFGATAAYTLDGGAFGEVEYENFNAAAATVTIRGRNTHPGDAKGTMINALRVAMEFDGFFSPEERPETTEGYEGFYHLTEQSGTVDSATLSYILRDHDAEKLEQKKSAMKTAAKALNARYGAEIVSVDIVDSYRNMAEIIADHRYLIDAANEAVRACGREPITKPIRGGTDGAQLSFKGLPCPNLGTGSHRFHSRTEYACVEEMDLCVEMLKHLITTYANM
ncbi:MAG: peptidase T [Clostridia bacterium]|nr:peptidase T [Clostridia bacterium]